MQKLAKTLEYITSILLLLTILSVFSNVVMRYVFNDSLLAIQELEWHFFAAMFLLAMSYATLKNAHVRVDLWYQNFKTSTQCWINLIGMLVFVVPISIVIAYDSFEFSYAAFSLNEQSPDPGGLPYRFIIKSIIPISFILLVITSVYSAYQSFLILTKHKKNADNYRQNRTL